MMPPIIEELKGKKIAILGFGREGQSTYRYIRKYLKEQEITISDERTIDGSDLYHVNLQCGKDYQQLHGFDLILKSPGIVLDCEDQLALMDSQSNMFLKYYGSQTIGITGTKGKSTTASLLYHILKESGKDVVLVGNIGKPVFDTLEQITSDTIVVFELSCHQLEYVRHDPHIGVLLNIYEEHLDHYGSFEKYQHAKENIWRMQTKDDLLICEKTLCQEAMKAHIKTVSMADDTADIVAKADGIIINKEVIPIGEQETRLLGHHNLFDIAVVFYLAQSLKVDKEHCLHALKTFMPLAHRLQFVGIYHDIHWYDDSISTICETTIQALDCIPNVETVLIGGMDRGIDYSPLAHFIQEKQVKNLILMPDSGSKLATLLDGYPVHFVHDLKEAVTLAKKLTSKGKSAVLSPAAASYGFFKNFEERGECFQQYVKSEE